MLCSVTLCFAALSASAAANAACDQRNAQYRDCVRLVDSLRSDKAGQMRVFAADGSEFNAGQVLWMKGQLQKYARLCAHGGAGEEAEAVKVLAGVRQLLDSHHRQS
jgi:hypothetical protein